MAESLLTRRTPSHIAVAITTIIAVLAPALVWFDTGGPLRTPLVLTFWILVPGVVVAMAIGSIPISLRLGLVPAVSVGAGIVASTAQMLLNAWSPAMSMSILALLHIGALPRAWSQRQAPRCSSRSHRLTCRLRLMLCLGMLIASGLWWWAVIVAKLDEADGWGLLKVAPWQYWASILLLVGMWVWALRRSATGALIMLTALLAAALYTFTGAIDGVPPIGTTFVHLGIIDAIETTGFIPRGIEARFSWPGFFLWSGAVLDSAGISDPVPLLVWYPALLACLTLPSVWTIGRAVGGSERAAWLTVLIFVTGNWVQQDYFSAQSVAYLTYVTIAAVLIWQVSQSEHQSLGSWRRWWRLPAVTPGRPRGWSARQTVAVELLIVALVVGIVVSHQLTPVALTIFAAALSLSGLARYRTLWVATGTIATIWFAFGATDWWTGHLAQVIDGFGRVGSTVESSVSHGGDSDLAHQRAQTARMAFTAGLGVLGLIGLWRIRERTAWAAALMVAAPAAIVLVQSYGGEVLLRVFLYGLPGLSALVGAVWARSATRPASVFIPALALAVSLTAARGVNVAFERTPSDVLVAARWVLDKADRDTTVAPLRSEGVLQQSKFRVVDSPRGDSCSREPIECIMRQKPDVVFLSTTLEKRFHLREGTVPGAFTRELVRQLVISGRYRISWDTDHVVVLERANPSLSTGASS